MLLFLIPMIFISFYLRNCGQILAKRFNSEPGPLFHYTFAKMEIQVEKTIFVVGRSFVNLIESTLKSFESTDSDLRRLEHAETRPVQPVLPLQTQETTPKMLDTVKVTNLKPPISQKSRRTEISHSVPSVNPYDGFDQDSWLLVSQPPIHPLSG